LPYSKISLKPPFKATTEEINCVLPMVKRYNPVTVKDWCHGWALKNELCHFASNCHAYLDLLIHRINQEKTVNADVLRKMGLDCEILKRARR